MNESSLLFPDLANTPRYHIADSRMGRIEYGQNISLEEYLEKAAKHERNWLQRIVDKYRKGPLKCLGEYRLPHHIYFNPYFLFWCRRCQSYRVSYLHGFEGRLDCDICFSLLNHP